MQAVTEKESNPRGLADAQTVFLEGFAAGIKPVEDINVWQWADEFRVIAGEAAAEPGPYRSARTPYLRAIMEALSPQSEAQIVIFMKPTQFGATEVANNWAMHTVAVNPGPFAFYLPTETDAATHSKMKFQPSVEETEVVREKLIGDNTIMSKMFLGTPMKFMGAETPRNYRHMTWKFIDAEEVDEWPYDVGGQGDPTELLIKRMDTMLQQGGKLYMPCSPTIDGLSKIQRWWNVSDQRHLYVPCPICGEYQILFWKQLKFTKDDDYNLDSEPQYQCIHCSKKFSEHHKTAMLEAHEWRASKPTRKIYGFHANSLYSPLGWLSWESMCDEWLRAHKENDPTKLKVFVNTRLAEVWKEDTDVRDPSELMKRREVYPAQVPAGACILVAGTDVQKDRLETSVIAFGPGFENWGIEHKVFRGDIERDEVWEDHWSYIFDNRFQHESGLEMKIAGASVDTGAFTDTVYGYVRPYQGRRIFAVKGKGGDRAPITVGKVFKKTITLFTVGTDAVKERIFAWLRTKKPEGHMPGDPIRGYSHFPVEYDDEYFDQLTGEVAVLEKGRKAFKPRRAGQAVEKLDCFVYAYATLKILDVDLDRRMKIVQRKAAAIKAGKPVPKPGRARRKIYSRVER